MPHRHGQSVFARIIWAIMSVPILVKIVGIGVVLLGKAHPSLEFLFTGAWFSGFFVSGAVYLLLMRGAER